MESITKKYSKLFEDIEFKKKYLECLRLNEKQIELDFRVIEAYDFELSESLLMNFEKHLNIMQSILDSIVAGQYIDESKATSIKLRLTNLPKIIHKMIWQLRTEDLGELISVSGYVKKISEILHREVKSTFECKECGERFTINQIYEELIQPTTCKHCGSKGSLKKIDRKIKDIQKLSIEEDTNDLIDVNQNPRRLMIILQDDLCRQEIDQNLQPSKKVTVYGILSDEPIKKKSRDFKKYLEAHNISLCEETYTNMKFSPKDIKLIKEMSKIPNFFNNLSESIFSTIYGNDDVKTALTLQMFSGTNFYDGKYLEERGVIHLLLLSSPGAGKTVLMRRAMRFVPGSQFSAGKGASGAGLVAAVVKDEEMGGFALESGMIPMCHEKIAYIDEADKIHKNDLAMLNNALVDLQVRIDKASIHQSLRCNTAVCCAANPVNRVFDKNVPVWKQIGLPKDFLDRFDIVMPIDAITSEEAQRNVAKVIFQKLRNDHKNKQTFKDEIIIKYIGYARQNINPTITLDIEKYIVDNYVSLVKPMKSVSGEEEAYFSTRLLTNIIRLTCAVAKAHLRKETTEEDAQFAINLLISSLKKQEIFVNGGLDIFKLEAIAPKKKRDLLFEIKNKIKELSEKHGSAKHEDLFNECSNLDIDEQEFDEIIFKLINSGQIYEPRRKTYHLIY